MSPDRRDSDNPEKWIKDAETELFVAQMPEPEIPPKFRCCHAHQAAEKALKALCLAHGVKAGAKAIRTHSLQDLLTLLRKNGVSIPAEVDRVKSLTFDRYPKQEESVTSEEAEEAVKNARLALDWAKGEIARTPSNSLAAK